MLSVADYSDSHSDSDDLCEIEPEDVLDRLTKVCFLLFNFFVFLLKQFSLYI